MKGQPVKRRILQTIAILAGLISAGPILNSWIPIGQGAGAAVWQLTGTGSWSLNYMSPLPPSGGVVDINACSAQVRAHLAENGTGSAISDTLRVAGSTTAYFTSGGAAVAFTGLGGIRVQIDSANAATVCYVEVRL